MKRGWMVIFGLLLMGNFLVCFGYLVYYVLHGKWSAMPLLALMAIISAIAIVAGVCLVIIEKYEKR